MTSIVDGLKDEYNDKLTFEIVKTTTERGQTEPEEYDLGRHGMVILSADGEEILWRKPGHKMSEDDVRNGIEKSLN